MFKLSVSNILFLFLFSIPNTLLSLGILVIINGVIIGRPFFSARHLGMIFFSMVVLSFLLNIFFQQKIVAYSYKLIYEHEVSIVEKFLKASFTQLEKIGFQRLYGIIEDLRTFVFLPSVISNTITSLMTLIICLVYFSIVSPFSAIIVVSLITMIAVLYMSIKKSVTLVSKVERQRQLNDNYFTITEDILKGFKGLKLSNIRRSNLIEKFLRPNRKSVKKLGTDITNRFLVINLFSQYGLYLVLGIVIFLLPKLHLLNKEQLTSFVISLLFIRGPIISLIAMQDFYTKAYVANKRITGFLKESTGSPSVQQDLDVEHYDRRVSELKFENVLYQYQDHSLETAFVLGPLNITIKEGETIFVIGGNGSGKSTFINLLTGICAPTSGKAYLNGREISSDSQSYCNHISAIFTDHHLFSEHYENYSLNNNDTYEQWLQIMELDNIISKNREASYKRNFSKGQGKRMALIFSILEERPILVLDEWAADQDPYFRKYFYETVLPKLKQQGKTIIAVTHDDMYFKQADRIIQFDYGQIVKDIPANKPMLTEIV